MGWQAHSPPCEVVEEFPRRAVGEDVRRRRVRRLGAVGLDGYEISVVYCDALSCVQKRAPGGRVAQSSPESLRASTSSTSDVAASASPGGTGWEYPSVPPVCCSWSF